jgi:hypothetical protein
MEEIIRILNDYYPLKFDRIELIRDMGSTSYTAFSGNNKYFLRVIKPAFFNTAIIGADIQLFLLICDMTEYFNFDERNFERSNKVLSRFVKEYRKYNTLSQVELDAFHALIAVQHFSTQATIMEIFGMDCLGETDIDNQLEWLYKWREQCG